MSSQNYQYTLLPCDPESVTQWAPKFINFRLDALKLAPKDTVSSYQLEAAIPLQGWIIELCKPVYRVLLCVARDVGEAQEKGEQDLIPVWEKEWAGILCLHGPRYGYRAADACHESIWYLGSGFVSPLHRGQSIMYEIFHFGLHQACKLDKALQTQRRGETARHRTRIQIIAKPKEKAVLDYYRTGGLVVTQHTTLGAYSQAGWNFLINADLLGMEIVVMERLIEHEPMVVSRL